MGYGYFISYTSCPQPLPLKNVFKEALKINYLSGILHQLSNLPYSILFFLR